ncbi:hypothetical protein D3C81_1763980 [compost metagenome]
MHGCHAQTAGQGGDDAADATHLGQSQMHGDVEGEDDDHQGAARLPGFISRGNADVVGLHGDEVGAPYAQARHQGGRDQIDPSRTSRDIASAIKQGQGDQQAEDGDEQGERQNPPVVLLDQAVQDRIHVNSPSSR